jgi:hypothetical protein
MGYKTTSDDDAAAKLIVGSICANVERCIVARIRAEDIHGQTFSFGQMWLAFLVSKYILHISCLLGARLFRPQWSKDVGSVRQHVLEVIYHANEST